MVAGAFWRRAARARTATQIEVNKRLYMDQERRQRNAGFVPLQNDLMALLDALCQRYTPRPAPATNA